MADELGGEHARERVEGTAADKPDGSAPARSPLVFVSDASAEAERNSSALRAAGYVVADVTLALLFARASGERPNVVLLDIDAEGALVEVARLRKLPGSGAIDFLYLGSGSGTVKNADDARAHDGSGFFARPVEIADLVSKIEALTGGPSPRGAERRSTPPSSLAPSRPPVASNRGTPSDRPSALSLPAPGVRTPGPPLPMSTTSLADLVDAPRSLASLGTVSPELQQLLADAEERASAASSPEVAVPSPEEEIEAVLPADILASLDEPIDGDDDEEPGGTEQLRTGAGPHDRDGTGVPGRPTTAGGARQPTTGSQRRAQGTAAAGTGAAATGAPSTEPPLTGASTRERRTTGETPARRVTGGSNTKTPAPPARSRTTDAGTSSGSEPPVRTGPPLADAQLRGPRIDVDHRGGERRPAVTIEGKGAALGPPRPSSWHPPPSIPSAPPIGEMLGVALSEAVSRGPSVTPAVSSQASVVVGPAEARRFLAEAVARRATGALCFESEGAVRRIVIREGDLVAAASGGEGESLVHFLAARGELPRDEAAALAAKIPPYGRHAGAALVAHGWLRQDQLWQVLRAHAEWIASSILRLDRATAQLEPDPPGRLRSEPSVFGAATGAEIFVDLVRRAVPVDDALERLGGEASRITDGPNQGLLAECNLPPQDLELLHRARGGTIADLLARATDGEIVAVVHALALLGVIEVVPAPDFARQGERSRPEVADGALDALDEDAIRARVRARLELVEEGDYFAVLGVARDATGYEIRRAFIELRRGFEPSRILTPRLLDLTDDIRKIIVVLEEAYEILRDNARRERYRRAIDARPE